MIDDVKLPFLKYDETIKSGETSAKIDGVFQRSGKFNRYGSNVTLNDGRKMQLSVNDASVACMVSCWGNDPSKWIGNSIKFNLIKSESSPTGTMKMWKPENEVQWKE